MTRVLLTYPTPLDSAQIERLLDKGELWVPCPIGYVCDGCHLGTVRHRHLDDPDPVWLAAAAEPCQTCDGKGKIKPKPKRSVHQPHYDLGYLGEPSKPCPDCRNGRKRIEVRTVCPCLCHGPCGPNPGCACYRTDGTVLAATASVAEVVGPVTSWVRCFDRQASERMGVEHHPHSITVRVPGRSIIVDDAFASVDLVGSWLLRLTEGERV